MDSEGLKTPYYFRPRFTLGAAAVVCGVNFVRSAIKVGRVLLFTPNPAMDANSKGLVVVGLLGGGFAVLVALYGFITFERNQIKLVRTFKALEAPAGVEVARRFWFAAFWLAMILIIASFGCNDLIVMKLRH